MPCWPLVAHGGLGIERLVFIVFRAQNADAQTAECCGESWTELLELLLLNVRVQDLQSSGWDIECHH